MPWHQIDARARPMTEADILVGKVIGALCLVLLVVVVVVLFVRWTDKPCEKKKNKRLD